MTGRISNKRAVHVEHHSFHTETFMGLIHPLASCLKEEIVDCSWMLKVPLRSHDEPK